VGKVATKAYVMLDWFLAYYTEEIRQFIFSRSYGFQKLGLHPNAHTVEIDLEKENHLTLFTRHSSSP
jgi:hypothetical protein